MTFRAYSIEGESTEAKRIIQSAAHDRIFAALELEAKINALAAEFAEQAPGNTDAERLEQAKKWAIEAVCDYVAMGSYELIFIE